MIFVLSATRNFYKYLPINVFNIIRSNQVSKIYIFIEDDALNLPFINCDIQYINMHKIGIDEKGANYNTSFSIATLCRLYLADFIPEDKVIYCDVDTVVVNNLRDLWDTDISNYYVAGVKDTGIQLEYKEYAAQFSNVETYINVGVLLFNLKKIREDNKTPELLSFVNEHKLQFPDQDTINHVFQNKILCIDSIFNAGLSTEIKRNFCIYHWAGLKKNWVYDREFGNLWTQSERDFIELFASPVNKQRDQ